MPGSRFAICWVFRTRQWSSSDGDDRVCPTARHRRRALLACIRPHCRRHRGGTEREPRPCRSGPSPAARHGGDPPRRGPPGSGPANGESMGLIHHTTFTDELPIPPSDSGSKRMPDKPDSWAWFAAWLQQNWPAFYAGGLAAVIAALRIMYGGGTWRRVLLEA